MNWYTYYADSPGGPTAIKQGNLNNQVFRSQVSPNIDHASSQAFEKAFRSKYGFECGIHQSTKCGCLRQRRTKPSRLNR